MKINIVRDVNSELKFLLSNVYEEVEYTDYLLNSVIDKTVSIKVGEGYGRVTHLIAVELFMDIMKIYPNSTGVKVGRVKIGRHPHRKDDKIFINVSVEISN